MSTVYEQLSHDQRIAQASADLWASKAEYDKNPTLENKNNVRIDENYLSYLARGDDLNNE